MVTRRDLKAAVLAASALIVWVQPAAVQAADASTLDTFGGGPPTQQPPTQQPPTQQPPTQKPPTQQPPTQQPPTQQPPTQQPPTQQPPTQQPPTQQPPTQQPPTQGTGPTQSLPNVMIVKVPFDQNGVQKADGATVEPLTLPVYVDDQGNIDMDRLANDAMAAEATAQPMILSDIADSSSEPATIQQIFQQADQSQNLASRWHYWAPVGTNGFYAYGFQPYWGPYSWYDANLGYQMYAPTFGFFNGTYAYAFTYGAYRPYNNYYYYFYYW